MVGAVYIALGSLTLTNYIAIYVQLNSKHFKTTKSVSNANIYCVSKLFILVFQVEFNQCDFFHQMTTTYSNAVDASGNSPAWQHFSTTSRRNAWLFLERHQTKLKLLDPLPRQMAQLSQAMVARVSFIQLNLPSHHINRSVFTSQITIQLMNYIAHCQSCMYGVWAS